jgi:hypothetical protein
MEDIVVKNGLQQWALTHGYRNCQPVRYRPSPTPQHEEQTLMMEAACASETLVYSNETARHYIPERCHLQTLEVFIQEERSSYCLVGCVK